MDAKSEDAPRRNSMGSEHRGGAPRRHQMPSSSYRDPVKTSSRTERFISPDCADCTSSNDDDMSQTINATLDVLHRVAPGAPAEISAYFNAPRTPPITKASLSELDIGSIINNSKLRHDVNFDRELHFRPNMDGERGRKKRDTHVFFWLAITIELKAVFYILQSVMSESQKSELIKKCSIRLRLMFETIKEILKNLVPERDQADVDEHLDVDLLMQEISRGNCNFVSISTWMAQLLKRHCAPMRDEMVDRMVVQIADQSPASITAGLTCLFDVLEAMKLDVANHQIRHLRAPLIEDTINFEKKYHFSRMKKHRYDCESAQKWYKAHQDNLHFSCSPSTESWFNKDVKAFVIGLCHLILPTTQSLPDTFALDADRIRQLRGEIDESIRESICCDILNELVAKRGGQLTPTLRENFRHRLQIIAGDIKVASWHCRAIDDIACEMVRCCLQATGSKAETDAELEELAVEKLDARLWALVRARIEDRSNEKHVENRYRIDMYAQTLLDRLYPRILRLVEEHLNSSPYDIFMALVPPPSPPSLHSLTTTAIATTTTRTTDKERELERRIAHIAVLHWRTWSDLVYNNEDLNRESEEANSTRFSSRASTPGPQPTLKKMTPAAQPLEDPAKTIWVDRDNTGEEGHTTEAPA